MKNVFISIGTNLGNRSNNIRQAIERLCKICAIKKISRPYRTKPYNNMNQPDYINLVAGIEYEGAPEKLLEELNTIEEQMGRVRNIKWDSRVIDLDIVYFGDMIINGGKLIIPHYDMHNRFFVLKPLSDIEPDYIHPVLGLTTSEMLSRLSNNL